MKSDNLTAISPVDGRYRSKTEELAPYFSEFALIRYRLWVETEYFISLIESGVTGLKNPGEKVWKTLREIHSSFSHEDAVKIKEIEKITNHDVKAVEYFLKEKFDLLGLSEYKEFIHFGLTSQDINNTAVPASLKDALEKVYFPQIVLLISKIDEMAESWKDIPMLARTHGQPASPTRLGKEFKVFSERLQIQLQQARSIPFSAKFGGATGNLNAHKVAYPAYNWINFANHFVNEVLGLNRSQTTTQIEHYDNIAALCDALSRINTILTDFSRDIWTYISMDYFKQKIREGEIGSSAMPHKVNPIDFENAEGNLGMANAVFHHLSAKLPVSRLQRDLTDSTVLRNIGVPLAHSLIAFKSLEKGIGKLIINETKIAADLDINWAVIAEAIQTILRREAFPKPYEALLALTRTNKPIDKKLIHEFIDSLDIKPALKQELKNISPKNYTGL
ncbi:MAG: adenylosuccinate lyase [Bacteroidales bacterium]|nr:adenylosuccinate lyase [Bacteroidales bacterium]MCB9013671.1 adenylosuccinate lyase [Bacteroidales bacterium]